MTKRTVFLLFCTAALIVIATMTLSVALTGKTLKEHAAAIVYDGVPPMTQAVAEKNDQTIRMRVFVVERRSYRLNFRVYFANDNERRQVAALVGGPIARPSGEGSPPGVLTTFNIIVRSPNGNPILEHDVRSNGRDDTAIDSLGRSLDEIDLSPGQYELEVKPTSDLSSFRPFKSSLEFTYHPKSTPIL